MNEFGASNPGFCGFKGWLRGTGAPQAPDKPKRSSLPGPNPNIIFGSFGVNGKLSLRGMAGIAHRYISDCWVSPFAPNSALGMRSQSGLAILPCSSPFYAALFGRSESSHSAVADECRRLLLVKLKDRFENGPVHEWFPHRYPSGSIRDGRRNPWSVYATARQCRIPPLGHLLKTLKLGLTPYLRSFR